MNCTTAEDTDREDGAHHSRPAPKYHYETNLVGSYYPESENKGFMVIFDKTLQKLISKVQALEKSDKKAAKSPPPTVTYQNDPTLKEKISAFTLKVAKL